MTNVILEKSLANCHCRGLDSLVIKDAPRMVRVFVARRDHELYHNHPFRTMPLSIAVHRHHCDVTLMPIAGEPFNVALGSSSPFAGRLRAFRYSSPILGEGRFGAVDETVSRSLVIDPMSGPLFLRADEMHTVYVPKGETAAWMVWEGDESDEYDPVVYSDAHLENFDFSGINQPMTEARLREDLAILNVKLPGEK